MTVLQRFLFPAVDLQPEVELYLKLERGATFSMVRGDVRLPAHGIVHFDTYFNGFSVGKWRRHSSVRNVSLTVEAIGQIEVHAVLNHPYRAARVVAAELFDAAERTEFVMPPLDLDEMGDGQLYLRIECLDGDATIFGASVQTSDEPARGVCLGVVITTFNRPTYLKANIDRLARALKRVPEYDDRIQVLVVDNADNLDLSIPASAPIRVLPNGNLGGAGGFARGLITFRDEGQVSHVLFMDDDISFEPEIILRSVQLMAYANDPALCIAGAMLMEEAPHIQFESGALFLTEAIHPFRQIGGLLDLSKWRNLIENDLERPAGYGAWWYFAFPMALAKVNPLPVFVRGDDICFGLKHTGAHTVTMNGIGVWHQAFGRKNGPIAFFYEARNLPLVSVLSSDRYRARHLMMRFVHHVARMLLTMKYDTAAGLIAGTRAFLAGPDAWMATDHERLNNDLRARAGEQLQPLAGGDLATPEYAVKRWAVPKVGGIVSAALLSGHVFPKFLTRRGRVALKVDAWSPVSVFAREQVLYRYDPTGEGFLATRDRKRFFGLVAEALSVAVRVPFKFRRLKRQYRAAYADMTSDAYWHTQFAKHTAVTPAAEG